MTANRSPRRPSARSPRATAVLEGLEGRRLLSAGDLDSTFAGDGVALDRLDPMIYFRAVAAQSDGRLVAAGTPHPEADGPAAVVRYDADGSLDASFGAGGRRPLEFAGGVSMRIANDVVVQGDGKILVAGEFPRVAPGYFTNVAIVRLNADGSLDTSFGGGDGVVTYDNGPGTRNVNATRLLLQPDGRVLALGTADDPDGGSDFLLARLTSAGALDETFGGGDGRAVVDIDRDDFARDLAVGADGKIVVVGDARDVRNYAAVARLNADGSPDATFGGDGRRRLNEGFSGSAVALQSDGKVLIGGTGANGFVVARVDRGGGLDASWGSGGRVTLAADGPNEVARLLRQSDGKLVLVGAASNDRSVPNSGPERDVYVARLTAGGGLDSTFGDTGRATFHFHGSEIAAAATLAPGGRLVAAGYAFTDGSEDANDRAFVLRLQPDGRPSTPPPTNPGEPTAPPLTATLSNGSLVVRGSDDADLIRLALAGGQVTVQITSTTGQSRLSESFDAGDVTGVRVDALAGDDKVWVEGGANLPGLKLYGSTGDDTLVGGAGNDFLSGNGGRDRVFGGGGKDRLNGHGGHDRLYGEGDADRLYGHNGNDWLDGGASNDRLYGAAGVDTFFGQGGNDFFAADDGVAESIFAASGTDSARADEDTDLLSSVEALLG